MLYILQFYFDVKNDIPPYSLPGVYNSWVVSRIVVGIGVSSTVVGAVIGPLGESDSQEGDKNKDGELK